ncbi:hypothetical protein [Devosia sp.]|uniref:hypothetical protein n=1 Tax=Devosia sp. TaxID=1871048 RepID=UPI0025BA2C12|nr:hypothetical protein [Devosia sp.]
MLEVQSHLDLTTLRAVALQATAGLSRGVTVRSTGSPITVPVGAAVLGRAGPGGGHSPNHPRRAGCYRLCGGVDGSENYRRLRFRAGGRLDGGNRTLAGRSRNRRGAGGHAGAPCACHTREPSFRRKEERRVGTAPTWISASDGLKGEYQAVEPILLNARKKDPIRTTHQPFVVPHRMDRPEAETP